MKKNTASYVMGGMAGVLFVLIIAVFSLSIVDSYVLRNSSLASVISAVLVDLTNSDRGEKALGGLTINSELTAAAEAKADDMAAKGYFAHMSPNGENSWYWFKQAGYTFLYAGENLAVDFSDSVDVEKAWMNSPTHRANILDSHFTEIGIATAQGNFEGHPTTFVVQMFGTPSPTSDLVLGKPVKIVTATLPKEPTVPAFATTVMPAPKATTISVAATAPVAAAQQVLGTEAGSILPTTASWWQHLLASPKTMLRYAYYALAGVILILLAYVTELEFHKRHMRHVWAAAFFFVLMIVLLAFASFIFFSPHVVSIV